MLLIVFEKRGGVYKLLFISHLHKNWYDYDNLKAQITATVLNHILYVILLIVSIIQNTNRALWEGNSIKVF